MSDSKIKASLYIDGNFTVHIHKYLAKNFGKTINWEAFQDYIKAKISKEEQNKICVLNSSFFVGTGIKTTDSERDFLFNSMEHAGIIKHATPLKQKVEGGLKEDAVDTNLVFFATQDYYKRENYDYLVLMAGDSDFVPLVKGLSSEGVKTFIIYMDFTDSELGKTQTAQSLLESSEIRENIETLRLERVDDKIKEIFTDYTYTYPEKAKPLSTVVLASPEANENLAKKKIVIVKKTDTSLDSDRIPFTKQDLIQAIQLTQKNKCNGLNNYVLIAQMGEFLNQVTGLPLHGKLFNMIKKNFGTDFDFDTSNKDAPKIRLL